MHFGFYVTTSTALAWAHGKYSDADLLLLDDKLAPRSAKNFYWVGSVKNFREAFELRPYGPRYVFRTAVPSIIRWAEQQGFSCALTEPNGAKRFWGTLKNRASGVC